MSFDYSNVTEFCKDLTKEGLDSKEANMVCGTAAQLDSLATGINVFFLLFAGACVFLMQCGFAMLCAGSVRQKNVKNIMLKNLLDACGGALGFWSIGFALAYGKGDTTGTSFIETTNFFLSDFKGSDQGYNHITWFFQFAFAATAATIVAGTVAERCKMQAYLCYSVFLTAFVYPVVVHSIWSGKGFLSAFNSDQLFRGQGVIDFAGSGVVHMTGGATALCAAIVLGPRKGRFYDEDGKVLDPPAEFRPHSVSLQVLGTFILWFGWYGFNPGSALLIASSGSGDVAAICAVTTTIAAATGCVTAMFTDTIIQAIREGEASYDLSMAMNGALSGLVAVTAGTSVVQPWAAFTIGFVAGWVYYGCSKLLIALKIDDAVDAIPVHFGNGLWGLIAVGLFAEESLQAAAYSGNTTHVGWVYNAADANLLLIQFVAACWIMGWVSVTMIPFFIVLKILGLFRVDPLEEEVGLDISHHRGAAYDLSGASENDIQELQAVRESRHGRVDVPPEEDGVALLEDPNLDAGIDGAPVDGPVDP